MKKAFLIFSLLAIFINSGFSQEPIDSYYNSYFDKERNILASEKGQNLELYLELESENTDSPMLLNADNETKIIAFRNALIELKAKFSEWKSVAKKNRVTDFKKEFDISFPKLTLGWYYDTKWVFDFNKQIVFYFSVLDENRILAAAVGVAEADTNEFITQKYYLAFLNVEEIETLINKIHPDNIRKKLHSKKATEDLFK